MTVLSAPASVTFDCLVTDQFTSIREKFSRVDRSASNALTTRSSKKTAGNKMKRKPKVVIKNWISHFQTTRPHVMMMLIFSSEEFPASEEVFASTAELGSVNCSILALLWSYVIASTFCSFMHSIPSFPYFAGWRLCVHLQPPLKNMLRRPWGGTSFVQIFENF